MTYLIKVSRQLLFFRLKTDFRLKNDLSYIDAQCRYFCAGLIYGGGLVFFRLENELSFVRSLIYGGKQMNVEMLMMSINKFIIYVEGLVFFRLKNDLS
jgi:hypothetical protein